MAKPTKKKVTAGVGAPKKPIVKTRKLLEPIKRSAINFYPENQTGQSGALEPPLLASALERRASPEVLNRLWKIIESRKSADPDVSHSARLLARGKPRVAQKLGEEATECLIAVLAGNRVGRSERAPMCSITFSSRGCKPAFGPSRCGRNCGSERE